ncbi:MAG TPA: hypothetical protein PKA88_20880 [Polyangiaceae bacterium]|nr:hypothetical protein [Polyangiaceae bacterium]
MAHEHPYPQLSPFRTPGSAEPITSAPRLSQLGGRALGLAPFRRVPVSRPQKPERGEITELIDLSFDDEEETRALPVPQSAVSALRREHSATQLKAGTQPYCGESFDAATRVMGASELPDHRRTPCEDAPDRVSPVDMLAWTQPPSSGRPALLPPMPQPVPRRAGRSRTLLELVLGVIAVASCALHVADALQPPSARLGAVAHSVHRAFDASLAVARLSPHVKGSAARCATPAASIGVQTGRVLSLDELPIVEPLAN